MKILLLLLLFVPVCALGQVNYTISGKIVDSETGEDLVGSTLSVVGQGKGVGSNQYGFYSLSLPEDRYRIRISYIGYQTVELNIYLKSDTVMNFELASSVTQLDEVTVSSAGKEDRIRSVETGVERISLRDVAALPVIFGERDILKTIQLLPGISNSSEGNSGFNVRGGSMGQNLILLDEATVYSSSHLMGFFSVFNSDAVKDITVYKGGIPSCYGGRAASVLDVAMKNGNSKKMSVSGGLGLISSRLTVEGPIIKDKMSFILTGRRTYADILAKALFPEKLVNRDMQFYFYDLNAKLNSKLNDKNRLFLSGYLGKDVFELGDDIGTGWGNKTGTIRWNHLFSDKLFSNSSLIYSRYEYNFINSLFGARLKSGIVDISFKEDFTYYLNPDFKLKYGMNLIYHLFRPGEVTMTDSTGFGETASERRAWENAIYIQCEHKVKPWLSANYGIRVSSFFQTGPGWFYIYDQDDKPVDSTWYKHGEIAFPALSFEPRTAINFIIDSKNSLRLSYNRMAQYIHLLSNTTSGSPTDIWMPGSNNLKPLLVDQISAGYFRNLSDNNIELVVEAYYKNIHNAADYKDGADIIFNEYGESQVLTGRGRSYGVEYSLKKNNGPITGWISYTLSKTENKIQGINSSDWYPVKYDKTHDVSVVAIWKVSERVSFSGVWIFATGNAVTFPDGSYILDNTVVPYYTNRNGYRMPDYHRLDLGITVNGKKKRKVKSLFDFSIYNVYNRHNAYMITFRESETEPGTTEAVKLSLFGIVPSLTYNLKF